MVGPSGCGKSTMLRMLAGLEEITEGEIYMDNQLVNQVLAKDRNIAMVFQNYALYPHMSVYKNMEFGLKMQKVDAKTRKEIIERTARQLQIEELLQRKPSQLSGGQKQRVALGRAMVRKPKVFLLDEPLSNLDAKLRTEMRVIISKLHKQLETIFVYVTHDQTEAMTMADRIVVMKDGYIQQVDTPKNIYNSPANLFVAEFMGTPQINIFSSHIRKGTNTRKETTGYFLNIFGIEYEIQSKGFSGAILKEYDGKAVFVGIRPEVFFFSGEPSKDCPMKLRVELKEELGSECYVYLSNGEHTICVKAYGSAEVETGSFVFAGFHSEEMLLFDGETEGNLGL